MNTTRCSLALLTILGTTTLACESAESRIGHKLREQMTPPSSLVMGILDDGEEPPVELYEGDLVNYGGTFYRLGGPALQTHEVVELESVPGLKSGNNVIFHGSQGDAAARLLGADAAGSLIFVGPDGAAVATIQEATDAAVAYGLGDIVGAWQDVNSCLWAVENETFNCINGGGDRNCCLGIQLLKSAECGLGLGPTVPLGVGQNWAIVCGGSGGSGSGGGAGSGAAPVGGGDCSRSTEVSDTPITIHTEGGNVLECTYSGTLTQRMKNGECVWGIDGGFLTGCEEVDAVVPDPDPDDKDWF